MTDLEISKALALAIGWQESDFSTIPGTEVVTCLNGCKFVGYFDYRDWSVIGPIAERFDCFPRKRAAIWRTAHVVGYGHSESDTPQKAIALAVIGGVR